MNRVRALVEGQTEQAFVAQVLAPHLLNHGVHIFPTLLGKPGRRRGGIRRYESVRRDILAALKENRGRFVTTMFDYYKLPNDWPGATNAAGLSPTEIGLAVAAALHEDIVSEIDAGPRFVPYSSMYEFVALLFSDPGILASTVQVPHLVDHFGNCVRQCGSPEAIDDGENTAPSKRIKSIAPQYDKVVHGTIAAQRIGLPTIKEQCPHFARWLETLEHLVEGQS